MATTNCTNSLKVIAKHMVSKDGELYLDKSKVKDEFALSIACSVVEQKLQSGDITEKDLKMALDMYRPK